MLRATNPSPYMYLLRFDDFDIVGSSPEAHLKVSADDGGVRRALLHPIAGTRWRGATPEQDNALAAELLADPKERSEHVMLVDLGRNDLGRVCRAGHGRGAGVRPHRAVQPRHAHRLDRGRRAARRPDRVRRAGRDVPGRHAVRRAEGPGHGDHRGAGADPARPLRRHGRLLRLRRRHGHGDRDPHRADRATASAYVGAGAGIVADSDPAAEEQETRNKAAAVLAAIAAAETLRAGPR